MITGRMIKRKEKSGEIIAYSETAIRMNMGVLEYCRSSMSALAGCAAGILGLSSLYGFAFYLIMMFVLWMLILLKAGPEWNKFFTTRLPILTGSLSGGIFTYVLFWTFLYGMVHVY